MITIAIIIIGVSAIVLASQTPIIDTDAGRLFLVAAVTALVVCSPCADGMPVVDRLAAALVGGYVMHRVLSAHSWPAPYTVLRQPPRARLAARPSAYTMRLQAVRVTA